MLPFVAASKRLRQVASDSGVTLLSSPRVMARRESGAGFVGNGWVGQAASPGTSLPGTGRSSTGKSGWPWIRSRTYTKPIFVTWATAGISLPPRRRVKSTGCAGMS